MIFTDGESGRLTIIVLKAKEVIVAILTPLERVRVSKTSAGMIHDKGPVEMN